MLTSIALAKCISDSFVFSRNSSAQANTILYDRSRHIEAATKLLSMGTSPDDPAYRTIIGKLIATVPASTFQANGIEIRLLDLISEHGLYRIKIRNRPLGDYFNVLWWREQGSKTFNLFEIRGFGGSLGNDENGLIKGQRYLLRNGLEFQILRSGQAQMVDNGLRLAFSRTKTANESDLKFNFLNPAYTRLAAAAVVDPERHYRYSFHCAPSIRDPGSEFYIFSQYPFSYEFPPKFVGWHCVDGKPPARLNVVSFGYFRDGGSKKIVLDDGTKINLPPESFPIAAGVRREWKAGQLIAADGSTTTLSILDSQLPAVVEFAAKLGVPVGGKATPFPSLIQK